MRAAWWWIDRWRKSTAYIAMTIEEQGLYRNLLDAVWIFEDGIIPDTERALVAASGGDQAAWVRGGEKVLKWMERRGDGWTNQTALEVKSKSVDISAKRVEAGKSGGKAKARAVASRLANGLAKTVAKSYPPSPSPSPCPLQDLEKDLRTTDTAPTSSGGALTTTKIATDWNREAADDFREVYGADPTAVFFAQVKPVAKRYGWERTRPALKAYMLETPIEFLSVAKCLAVKIEGNGRAPAGRKLTAADRTMQAAAAFIARRKE